MFPAFAFASLILRLKTYGFLRLNQFLFAISVFTLRRTQVRLSGEERKIRSSRNIVEMRTRHSLASFLLVSVKHFEKTIDNCFFSFTLNLTSPFAKNIRIEMRSRFFSKSERNLVFKRKSSSFFSILDDTASFILTFSEKSGIISVGDIPLFQTERKKHHDIQIKGRRR